MTWAYSARGQTPGQPGHRTAWNVTTNAQTLKNIPLEIARTIAGRRGEEGERQGQGQGGGRKGDGPWSSVFVTSSRLAPSASPFPRLRFLPPLPEKTGQRAAARAGRGGGRRGARRCRTFVLRHASLRTRKKREKEGETEEKANEGAPRGEGGAKKGGRGRGQERARPRSGKGGSPSPMGNIVKMRENLLYSPNARAWRERGVQIRSTPLSRACLLPLHSRLPSAPAPSLLFQ